MIGSLLFGLFVIVVVEPVSVVACGPAHITSCTVTRRRTGPEVTIVSCIRLFCCLAGMFPVGEDSVFPVLCMWGFSQGAHSQDSGSHPTHSQLTSTGEQSVLRECFYLYPPSQDFVEFKACQACAHTITHKHIS